MLCKQIQPALRATPRSIPSQVGRILGIWIAVTLAVVAQENGRNLPVVWEFPTPREMPMAIGVDALHRPFLHVAMKNGGLLILNLGNKSKPSTAARIPITSFAGLDVMNLTQRGNQLFVALGDLFSARSGSPAGIAVVDITNPAKPRVTAVWKSQETMRGSSSVVVAGDRAYLGAMNAGIMIFDIARPDVIAPICTYQPDIHFPLKNPSKLTQPNVRGLAIHANRLYVAYDAGGLRILDVTDVQHPKEIGRYVNTAMGNKPQAFNGVVVDGSLAYLPCDYAGFEIVDVSNPASIRPVGWWNPWNANTLKNSWFNSPGHTNQIYYDPARKLAFLSSGASELQIIDVATPARPRLTGFHREPNAKLGVWGLGASDDRIYLGYITGLIPFQGTWAGIKAVER